MDGVVDGKLESLPGRQKKGILKKGQGRGEGGLVEKTTIAIE